jgi:hypothetical protein
MPNLATRLTACPERYIIAFPYMNPRHDYSVRVVGLPYDQAGNVTEGEYIKIWEWGDEGLGNFGLGGVTWLREVDEWPLMLYFLIQHFDGYYMTGAAYSHCPGDEMHLVGLFNIPDPDDFSMKITRFDDGALFDFWLQEGNQLRRLQYDSYEAIELWILEDVPGRLLEVEWSTSSPDRTDDGVPDLVITWDISGEVTQWLYANEGQGFRPVGELDSEK